MKRSIVIMGVIALLVSMAGAVGHMRSVEAGDHAFSPGCVNLNDAFWDQSFSMGTGIGFDLYGYESVRINAGPPVIGTPAMIEFRVNDVLVASAVYPGPLVYLFPTDLTAAKFEFRITPAGTQVVWDISCSYTPPGCDMVPIPAGAVVGKFVANAPVYWAPGKLANPEVTIPAGMTAWVFNLDPGGQYYRVLWACSIIYVPRVALAPNPDTVWHNAPLPGVLTMANGTQIVQGSTGQVGTTGGGMGVVPGVFPVNSAPVDAVFYVVQRGDNLYRIALHFGVNLARLAAVNGISNPSQIYAGQVLDIAAAR